MTTTPNFIDPKYLNWLRIRKNLAGVRFGKLTAIAPTRIEACGSYWLCRCDCGNECERFGPAISYGSVNSCGCLRRKASAERRNDFIGRLKPDGACLVYTGPLCKNGYGKFGNATASYGGSAHRFAWEISRGAIPDGLTIDHMCFRPSCCNPMHLRLLTRSENSKHTRRSVNPPTHCKHGHELSGYNVMPRSNRPGKTCRQCNKDAVKRLLKRRGEHASSANP